VTVPKAVHPEGWMKPSGYAYGVSAPGGGRIIVTAGQVGWNPSNGAIETEDFAQQAAQALRNVVAVLRAAGAGPEHLVRLTWFITHRAEYMRARKALGAAYREIIGQNFPAMSVIVVSGLLEEQAKVEIEATAVVPSP
jgi:enamine deaminase RidA (YjgF/YER057c/UK114 family)